MYAGHCMRAAGRVAPSGRAALTGYLLAGLALAIDVPSGASEVSVARRSLAYRPLRHRAANRYTALQLWVVPAVGRGYRSCSHRSSGYCSGVSDRLRPE
jgi:hypothetical protein